MVREWQVEAARRVSVVLHNAKGPLHPSDSNEQRDGEIEEAVSLAASVVDQLLDLDVDVELITHTDRVPFGRGPGHRWRILTVLALLDFVDHAPLSALDDVSGARRILVTRDGEGDPATQAYDRVFEVGAKAAA